LAFNIRPATADELDHAADVLAAAFDSYAWTRWTIPQDDYRSRLRRLQRMYLGYALEVGVVLVDDDLRGVVALLPPDAPAPSPEFQEQVADLHGTRLQAVAAVDIPAQPDGAWNLATVGVHPDSQGLGLGGALVRAGLDASGGQVALETSDDRNVRLYERLGFAVTATTVIPDGPVVHSMCTPPR
jgi:ribosomal protein S18 acetylase RimI-like enzyme